MCLLLFLGLFTYGLPSSRGGVYLRCWHLPAVLSPPRRVWIWVYLRWLLRTCLHYSTQDFGTFTSGGAEIFMPDGMGCIPAVLSPPRRVWIWVYLRWLLRTCLQYPPKNWDIYLRCKYKLHFFSKKLHFIQEADTKCPFDVLSLQREYKIIKKNPLWHPSKSSKMSI